MPIDDENQAHIDETVLRKELSVGDFIRLDYIAWEDVIAPKVGYISEINDSYMMLASCDPRNLNGWRPYTSRYDFARISAYTLLAKG